MNVSVRLMKRKRCTAVILDYRDSHGTRQRQVVGTAADADALKAIKAEAKREAARIQLELLEGRHKAKMGDQSIEAALVEFHEHMERTSKKASTKRGYTETIKKFRSFLKSTRATRLKDVSSRLVIRFVESQEGRAADTVCGDLTRLHRIFQRSVEQGMLLENPFKHRDVRDVWPKRVKHERAFTDADFAMFLDKARHDNRSPQAGDYADFFVLLADTGLRLGEGLVLRWCDVRFGDQGFLRVEPHNGWTPKSKSSVRTVPLCPRVQEMLRGRLHGKAEIDPRARIFPTNWTNRSVNQCFNRVLSRVGLDAKDDKGQKLRVHSLRHYFATRLVNLGGDPAAVRDLLGHESIVTTNRYFNTPRSELFNTVSRALGGVSERVPKVCPTSTGFERITAENAVCQIQ